MIEPALIRVQQISGFQNYSNRRDTGIFARESVSKPGVIRKHTWKMMEEWLTHYLIPIANTIKIPVSIVVGSEDTSCVPEAVQTLFSAMGNKDELSSLEIIQGSPHSFRSKEDILRLKAATKSI